MKISHFSLIVVACILAGGGIAFAQDPVHSNYTAGNGFDALSGYVTKNGCGIGNSRDHAMAFTVPLGFDYTLNAIHVPLRLNDATCTAPVRVELWSDASGLPGSLLTTLTLPALTIPPNAPAVYIATASGITLLNQNTKYWVVLSAANPNASVDWSKNAAKAKGPWANRPPGGTWTLLNNNADQAAFRVLGTPMPAQPVRPSYSSYTAPSGGGPATLYLEVVCPTNPLTNPFTMPVSVSIPPNQSPAQVCQILANAVNGCGINACPCWGGAACPSIPPYGFQAACSGVVLRITNSTTGLCPGAFVCVDHADGLTKYSAKKQLEGLTGAIALEIRGVATGVARDPTESNDVNVIRTLRSGADSPPQVFQGQVMLARGMEPGRILQSLAAAFSSQGDTSVVVEGNRVIFSPPGREGNNNDIGGNYDIAFQVNDTGLEYAFSPPFSYSFFDYVARFAPTPVPTFPKWGWIILIFALVVLGVIVILRWKKKA